MQQTNNLSSKIEQFYSEVSLKISNKYKGYSYKNVALTEIAVKFYLNEFINSTLFFKEIEATTKTEDWNKMIAFYVANFEIKSSVVQHLIFIFLDVVRYLKYASTKVASCTAPEYYFFITNKKFINYTDGIRANLSENNIKTGLLLWDTKDVNDTIRSISNTPKVAFPQFWTKNYFQFRRYAHLVDRVLGYTALRNAKKVILVEGCVVAEHIVSEVCKSKNIPNYCIQWGFFAKTVTQSGWRTMPFDKFITWGAFYSNQFKRYNALEIKAIGHPKLEDKVVLTKEKVVLFAVQKVMGEHILESNIYSFITFAVDFAKRHTDFTVIVRSHPDFKIPQSFKDANTNLKNLIWHDYQKFSLQQSLEPAKYCVSISSTVSLESIVFGCYPLFIKANDLPLQSHEIFDTTKGFEHVFDYDSFESGIEKLENSVTENYLKEMKMEFYKTLGNNALEAIALELTA